jgi:hypothetical protein
MFLPPSLLKKYLTRFDELISVGEDIADRVQKIPGQIKESFVRRTTYKGKDSYRIDEDTFYQWKVNCANLLSQIVPAAHMQRKIVEIFRDLMPRIEQVRWGIANLKALKADFEKGFLGNLMMEVESEFTADYMGQAVSLLKEGQSGKFDHVPAAVLSGAVLEKSLRTLCDVQQPPISIIKPNGERKTLDPLITDLKKTGIYNETKAKQLRAWAAIRNHAAHGEFDQFNREDVEDMIRGIKKFLARYCRG